MNFISTWTISVLMAQCRDELDKLEPNDWENIEKITDLYAQAIELTVKKTGGFVMPIDMCIEWITDGSIMNCDGHGYYLDKDGHIIDEMCCDIDFLKEIKEDGACFVAWYNK